MKKRIFIFLLGVLLFVSVPSCRKNGNSDPAEDPNTLPDVLTGIWVGEDLALPEGYETKYPTSYTCMSPEIDAETGRITCVLTGPDGPVLAVLDPERGVADSVPLPVPRDQSLTDGVFHGGDFWYLTKEKEGGRSYLNRFSQKTGTFEELGEVNSRFPSANSDPDFWLYSLAVDADGCFWLCANREIVVLSRELAFVTSFDIPGARRPEPDPSGSMAIPRKDGVLFCRKETGETNLVPLTEEAYRVVFCPGVDFLYSSASGIYAVNYRENGEAEIEERMNYRNSSMDPSQCALWQTIGEDVYLFGESVTENGWPRNVLKLYRSSADVSLSSLKVLEIAQTVSFASERSINDWETLIVTYNKTHPDARIILKDYTQYNTGENPDGGMSRLATEITTGIYRPDLILCSGESTELAAIIVSSGLHADLMPYMEADDTVNPENVFGAVLRMFSDSKGGIWGLPAGINALNSPLTTQAMLDAFAPGKTEKDGWTLDELLDFAESLPEEVEFFDKLTQQNAEEWLLGANGYSAFIRDGRADFESPAFLRWLEFYRNLPKDTAELKRVSRIASEGESQKYTYLYNGKVACQRSVFTYHGSFAFFETEFGTKDWRLMGCASDNGNGTDTTPGGVLVMMDSCRDKDLGWDLIRTLLTEENAFFMIPPLKNKYDEIMAEELNLQYINYFSGSLNSSGRDPDHPLTEADLTEPGIIVLPDENDIAHIRSLLDENIGKPLLGSVSEDVREIIREEISAFLGGIGSAESCAGKIQSRVSIWLAEHH